MGKASSRHDFNRKLTKIDERREQVEVSRSICAQLEKDANYLSCFLFMDETTVFKTVVGHKFVSLLISLIVCLSLIIWALGRIFLSLNHQLTWAKKDESIFLLQVYTIMGIKTSIRDWLVYFDDFPPKNPIVFNVNNVKEAHTSTKKLVSLL